jgi:pimeloyl-ACP methyl ester carboxylesterase
VLLHGFPLNPTMWDAQFSMANRGWRVLAPELRGFGADADNDPPVTSIDDYAGDAIDLLDGLHVTEAVIAGLSMGGYIAFAVFRHAARYFRGLVLADTRSEPDTPQAVDGRQRMQALVRERGPAAVADELVPKLTSDTTRRMHPEIVERLRAQIVGNSAASIHGALTALMSRPDSTPTLPGIHCPTLILVGEEDAITPPALSESMQRHIAGAELVTIPRAGHMSNMEQPAAFNDALARFLDHRV